MLTGSVNVGGHDWMVREEKRQGPRSQILILTAMDCADCEMHLRPAPGQEVATLEQVETLAVDPDYRWFLSEDDERWHARLVVRSEPGSPDVWLVKFISPTGDVHEGPYPFPDGLGARTDGELDELLQKTRQLKG